jgi:hypothetical protein
MKTLALVIITVFGSTAFAKEATSVASAATVVAGDGVNQPQIRAVGRLNVNTASREQLLKVPGLETAQVDAILAARPLNTLTAIPNIAADVLSHLKTDGESNFFRILQNPLVRLDRAPLASR